MKWNMVALRWNICKNKDFIVLFTQIIQLFCDNQFRQKLGSNIPDKQRKEIVKVDLDVTLSCLLDN